MEKDAISAGVNKIGGLFNTADIKILVCYLLTAINEPVPGPLLGQVLHNEGVANIFEVGDSLASLVKTGHILEHNDEDGCFSITDKGKEVADSLKTSLPIFVKNRAYKAVLRMFTRFKNAKETEFKVSHENERTFLTCSALDKGTPFMTIKLMVADDDHASFVKERFLENTSEIYKTMMELLTKMPEEIPKAEDDAK